MTTSSRKNRGSRPTSDHHRRRQRSLLLESLENRSLLATFNVSNLGDSGPGTLRQAIDNANATSGLDTITFSVAGSIKPTSQLPSVTDATIFDGTTVANYAGKPRVTIDGSLAGNASGLVLEGDGCTVKGLAINNFSGAAGLLIGSSNNTVVANHFGTDVGGTLARPNSVGIMLAPLFSYADVAGNVIGGDTVGERNIISGNAGDGIAILGGYDTVVTGNFIGVDFSGTVSLANGGNGVQIDKFSPFAFSAVPAGAGTGNQIGGTTSATANRIRSNGGDGVLVHAGSDNAVRGNSMQANGGLGINLGHDGVDENDFLDVDSGPNFRQNSPLTGGVSVTASSITAGGMISSRPNTVYRIDAYASSAADPSGSGEGQQYLGTATVTTDANGNAGWVVTANVSIPAGWIVTSTATDPTDNTSEFSNGITVPSTGAAATVRFYKAAPRFRENDGTISIYVFRTGNLSVTTKVNYSTANDSAVAGSDYSSRSNLLTFSPNQTVKVINIPLVNDKICEGVERFDVNLTNPVNAQLGTPPSCEVVILDDDVLDTQFSGDGKDTKGTTGSAADRGRGGIGHNTGYVVAGRSGTRISLARYNANGSLDTAFGSGGKAVAPLTMEAEVFDITKQADDKLIVVGNARTTDPNGFGTDTILMRYNANGTLDNTFGSGGIVRTNFNSQFTTDEARSVAVQGDGKIVVLATTENHFIIARYLTNGTLDTTFAGGVGYQTVDFGGFNDYDEPSSIAIGPDGKIVAAGTGDVFDGKFSIVRLNPNGSLDTTFSGDGMLQLDFGSAVSSVLVTPGNKIVVAGTSVDANSRPKTALVRINANGTLDTTFSGDGKVEVPAAEYAYAGAQSLVRQSDGKLVVGNADSYEILRFNDNGTLDTSFSGDGRFEFGFGQYSIGRLEDISLDSNGKLLVVGDDGSADFGVARVNLATATLDTGFSGDGKTTTDFNGPFDEQGIDVVTQPDGKTIVVATRTPVNASFSSQPTIVYRYNANGTLDTSFGQNGRVMIYETTPKAVALQPNGKIVIAFSNQGLGVLRLNANGTVDNSFSGDGRNAVAVQGFGAPSDIVVQSDGRVIVGGADSYYDYDLQQYVDKVIVARFNADGSVDNSYDVDGKAVVDLVGAPNLVLDAAGKLLVASSIEDVDTNSIIGVVRLTTSGALDTSFNGSGKKLVDHGRDGDADPIGIDLLSNGEIVVGGTFYNDDTSRYEAQLIRLLAGGGLKTSFGVGGIAARTFGDSHPSLSSMLVDAQDRIVVAGQLITFYDGPNAVDAAVARFLDTGDFDPEFGVDGIARFDFGPDSDPFLAALAEDADENLVVIGHAQIGANGQELAVARLRTSPDPGPFGTVQLNQASYLFNEAIGTVSITVTRSGDVSKAGTVDWRLESISATLGVDVQGQGGTLSFAAGQTTKTIKFTITNDTLDEINEVFRLSLDDATGSTKVGAKQNAQITITDNDPPPTISINNVSIVEGDSGTKDMVFTISLSAASGLAVSVTYHTTGGTATGAANDFTAKGNTVVTFNPGQTTKQVIIKIKGDTLDEANEQFFVDLLNPTNATIADSRGVGTITDDDP